jgi:hypothetical protein
LMSLMSQHANADVIRSSEVGESVRINALRPASVQLVDIRTRSRSLALSYIALTRASGSPSLRESSWMRSLHHSSGFVLSLCMRKAQNTGSTISRFALLRRLWGEKLTSMIRLWLFGGQTLGTAESDTASHAWVLTMPAFA